MRNLYKNDTHFEHYSSYLQTIYGLSHNDNHRSHKGTTTGIVIMMVLHNKRDYTPRVSVSSNEMRPANSTCSHHVAPTLGALDSNTTISDVAGSKTAWFTFIAPPEVGNIKHW